MPENKTAIIIAGPTAVGKTTAAIEVAKHLDTEIISADSRQCYRELSIGVARPSPSELEQVKHHFIASHSIHEKITAAGFEAYALEKAERIFETRDHLVVTGGTGLYIQAFCEGMDNIPAVPEELSHEIRTAYEQKGLSWLQEEVGQLDPQFYHSGENKNPHRLLRALEVYRATGHSILHFRKGKKAVRPFRVVKIALELPKDLLHRNIHHRVDTMMKNGLSEEVRTLIPFQHLNALQTVGYRELFDHFNGMVSMDDAIEQIKKNTRHYAKRQMTWFRKDAAYTWYNPAAEKLIAALPSLLA